MLPRRPGMKRSARRPAIGAISASRPARGSAAVRWLSPSGPACPRNKTATTRWRAPAPRTRRSTSPAKARTRAGVKDRPAAAAPGACSCRRTSATPIATPAAISISAEPGASALADPVDAGDDEPEREGVENDALKIEAPGRAWRRRQRPGRHHQREHADRDVDQKQPMPGGDRKDRRGDARAPSRRHGHHHRHVADPLAKPRVRIDESDERDVDAHDSRRAEALNQRATVSAAKVGASAQASEERVKSASPHQ